MSANNNRARHAWPSFVASAEGLVVSRAPAHRPAVLVNAIDTKARLYDATAAWRDRARRGIFHSGALVRDARSRDRQAV